MPCCYWAEAVSGTARSQGEVATGTAARLRANVLSLDTCRQRITVEPMRLEGGDEVNADSVLTVFPIGLLSLESSPEVNADIVLAALWPSS